MYRRFYIFILIALALASCTKVETMRDVAVQFNADISPEMTVLVRGGEVQPESVIANHAVLQAWRGDKLAASVEQDIEPGTKNINFTGVKLAGGVEYEIYIWVDCKDYYEYKVDDAIDLRSVKLASGKLYDGKSQKFDAFYAYTTVTLTQGANPLGVELKRPFALITFCTDVQQDLKIKFSAATQFNLKTGEVSGSGDFEYTVLYTNASSVRAFDYVFAGDAVQQMQYSFAFDDEDYTTTLVPFKRNTRTNIIYNTENTGSGNAVAIGENQYATLAEALKGITEDGRTIKFLKDMDLIIPTGFKFDDNQWHSVRFDLNGKTLTSNNLFVNFATDKEVTVGGGTLKSDPNKNGALIQLPQGTNQPTFNFNDGTYSVTNSGGDNFLLETYSNGTLNFNGGTYTGDILAGNGTLNIKTGATFQGNISLKPAFAQKNLTMNISGGKFEGNIILGPFAGTGYYKLTSGTLNISGGEFTGDISVAAEHDSNLTLTVSITGGKFKIKPDASYLAAGATCSETTDADGYYVVTSSN